MNNKKNVILAQVFVLLTVLGYLITYNNKILFFLVFVAERLYSFGTMGEIDKTLEEFEIEDGKKGERTLGFLLGLILATIGLAIYAIFKHPHILLVLILGELLDNWIYNFYINGKNKRD